MSSSSIHYKFRSDIEYKTIQFDGLWILCGELKQLIFAQEGLKAEAFDLILQNANTKRNYGSDDQIPRNNSVIVQRVPREGAEKLPKIQHLINTGVVSSSTVPVDSGGVAHLLSTSDFEQMTEEQRLEVIKNESTVAYHPSTYSKRPTGALNDPPPPTYTCNRCYQPGHWFKHCPMLNTRRTTGIPNEELMETTADDPLAMVHPVTGKHVIPIMHYRARQQKKKEAEEGSAIEQAPPAEFTCPICHHLLKDAVMTTCCGNTFCADCINQALLDSDDRHCPGAGCKQTNVSIEALIPNRVVRSAVYKWQSTAQNQSPAQADSTPEPVVKIRIGLQPSLPTTTTVVTTTSSTSSIQVPSTQVTTRNVSATSSPIIHSGAQPSTAEAPPGVSPDASASPAQAIPLPVNFSQPPPSIGPVMPSGLPTSISSVPPGMAGMTTVPGTSGIMMQPTIPGYIQPVYNYSHDSGQFYNAWEAFLNRKSNRPVQRDGGYERRFRDGRDRRDGGRDRREDGRDRREGRDRDRDRDRNRDRNLRRRREGSNSASPDRHRRDCERERSDRRGRDRDSRNDRDKKARRNRDEKHDKENRERDRSDRKRDDREKKNEDDSLDREDRKRREKRTSSLERQEKRRRSGDDSDISDKVSSPETGDVDEAAIDDALKEVEELEMMKADVESGEALEVDTVGSDTTGSAKPSPIPKINNDTKHLSASPRNISPRSSSLVTEAGRVKENEKGKSVNEATLDPGKQTRGSDVATADDRSLSCKPEAEEDKMKKEKEKEIESDDEDRERKKKKHKKHKKHKHQDDDSDERRSKSKKEKKHKKHKKEKRGKKEKHRSDESGDERQRRKREKKEKERRDRTPDKEIRPSSCKEEKVEKSTEKIRQRLDSTQEQKRDRDRREKSRRDQTPSKSTIDKEKRNESDKDRTDKEKDKKTPQPSKPKPDKDSKREGLTKSSDRKRSDPKENDEDKNEKAVVDESKIREHFSPPPTFQGFKKAKITLKI